MVMTITIGLLASIEKLTVNVEEEYFRERELDLKVSDPEFESSVLKWKSGNGCCPSIELPRMKDPEHFLAKHPIPNSKFLAYLEIMFQDNNMERDKTLKIMLCPLHVWTQGYAIRTLSWMNYTGHPLPPVSLSFIHKMHINHEIYRQINGTRKELFWVR